MDQKLAPIPYERLQLPDRDAEFLESMRVEVEVAIEPGHVMSREKYQQMLEEQQK